MQADPAMSVVVFQLVSPEGPIARATHGIAPHDDFLRQAWQCVAEQYGALAADVRQIYSEWEPSEADLAFVDATFPKGIDLSFSFRRPRSSEEWPAALAAAQATIREKLQQAPAPGELLPVVRDLDILSQAVVHRPLTPELGVFLAYVSMTPQQTLSIHYLTNQQLADSPLPLDETFRLAFENLIAGLKIEAGTAGLEKVFTVRHSHDLAVAALALPDFLANAQQWAGVERVFLAFVEPGVLYLTADADGPFASRMRRAVQTSDYYDAVSLTPSCYLLGPDGFTLLTRRTVIA
ncbi:MAG: hypothetical protein SNJ82_03635 [Gemmataceae bacterium]